MKRWTCVCGHPGFFDNTHCTQCGRKLGFDPVAGELKSLDADGGTQYVAAAGDRAAASYRLCRNYGDSGVCNWLVPADAPGDYCLSCELSRTIPDLSRAVNHSRWQALEAAKRRLLYALMALRLPVYADPVTHTPPLLFDFKEDQRTNPEVAETYVSTGHAEGVITINVGEADDVLRESVRRQMNEPYRTLLGHFRHESGHYYFDRLIRNAGRLEEFRTLFGDETADYRTSLDVYYRDGPHPDWQASYISAYAQAHPLEDWAETWAHFLHMVDTLETAEAYDVVQPRGAEPGFDDRLEEWLRLTVVMNDLNRSVGLQDAYPFVLSSPVVEKLRFIHRLVGDPPAPS